MVEEQHEAVVLTAGLPTMGSALESRTVKLQDTACTDEEAAVALGTWMDQAARGSCRWGEVDTGAAESALPLAVYSMAGCSSYLHHVSVGSETKVGTIQERD